MEPLGKHKRTREKRWQKWRGDFEPSDGADSSIPNQSRNYRDGNVWEEDDFHSGSAESELLRDTEMELFGRSGK